jgi:hypothetical protein
MHVGPCDAVLYILRDARASAIAARRTSLLARRELMRRPTRAHPYPPCHEGQYFLARDVAARLGFDGGEWLIQTKCLLLIGLVDGGSDLGFDNRKLFCQNILTC